MAERKRCHPVLAGHLLECSGQLTGGCFADPGMKKVEDLAGLGYPLADVWADGRVEVSKTPGAGGGINFGAKQILAVKSVLIPRD